MDWAVLKCCGIYLRLLGSDKAKNALAQFPYSGATNKNFLMKDERKFDQPQLVVCAYLDNFNKTPPVEMHNSYTIISFASKLSSMAGVFQPLS